MAASILHILTAWTGFIPWEKQEEKNKTTWKILVSGRRYFADGGSRRVEGPSCHSSSSLELFFLSSPPRLIPTTACLRINYTSIERPLIRGIDIHGPPSAPRPDVYCSSTLGPRPHASHRDYIIYCAVRGGWPVGEKRCEEQLLKEEEEKVCVCHTIDLHCCWRSSTATSVDLDKETPSHCNSFINIFSPKRSYFFRFFGAKEFCFQSLWEDYRLICGRGNSGGPLIWEPITFFW